MTTGQVNLWRFHVQRATAQAAGPFSKVRTMNKFAIIALSIILTACGGGDEEPPQRIPHSYETCKVPLINGGYCPEDKLVHNVPNIGELQK
jgi:hypothetical protein